MLIFTIKNLRKNKNISLTELSNQTDLSMSYLSDLENNKLDNCTTKSLEKIANALHINIKDLFYSKLDIKQLKEKLNLIIHQYGLNSQQALEQSQLIDLLINILNKEKEA